MSVTQLEADYLVIGAGASGMAFTDALIEHADVNVVMVDRRHGAGGHWLDAYPFVRLHQASSFYGVASTLLGDGRIQQDGPEAGFPDRATAAEISVYYDRVMRDRLLRSGNVTFFPGCEYLEEGAFVSRVSGKNFRVGSTTRIVDARYLSPEIPATTPPPFGVAAGARVVPVNELVGLDHAPSQYVVVGAGKTATDACIWLLANGVEPDSICWIRSREPWMLDRAKVQPDPATFLTTAATIMEASAAAATADEVFFLLEEAGVMLRLDPAVHPTMAKVPTLGRWELEQLRAIENVVRLGHVRHVEPGRLVLDAGEVRLAPDALVVHCAASGLRYRPYTPIWGPDAIRVQPIQLGFACFGAALAGVVEATVGEDAEKNRLCPPSPFSNTPTDWALQQVLGARASFEEVPHLKAWADSTPLNPGRVPPELAGSTEVVAAQERLGRVAGPGMARLAELAGAAS